MFSDVSSLTDIDTSEDESFTPRNKKSKKKEPYTLKGVLKAARTVTYSTQTLFGVCYSPKTNSF